MSDSQPRLQKQRRHQRPGSTLLLCVLVTTVLSMAGIAIVRSSQVAIARVDAQRSALNSRHLADSMAQSVIAQLSLNVGLEGRLLAPRSWRTEAYAVVRTIDATHKSIEVYLYERATVPAFSQSIEIPSQSP